MSHFDFISIRFCSATKFVKTLQVKKLFFHSKMTTMNVVYTVVFARKKEVDIAD